MEVVRFIEQKDKRSKLSDFLDEAFSGIQIKFGSDDTFAIGNSSLIAARYKRGGVDAGSIGIIGPLRLDYRKVVPYVDYLTEKLSMLMSGEDDAQFTNDNNTGG